MCGETERAQIIYSRYSAHFPSQKDQDLLKKAMVTGVCVGRGEVGGGRGEGGNREIECTCMCMRAVLFFRPRAIGDCIEIPFLFHACV